MKTSKNILIYLLLISTLLLITSYFLPFVQSNTSNQLFKNLDKNSFTMFELTQYDFNIYFILLPILGLVFMISKYKYSETFSLAFYISTFISNLFYLLSMNNALAESKFRYSSGMTLFLISNIMIALCCLVLLILNVLVKVTNSAIVEINSSTLKQSLENLNNLREQNFITASEYEEKRADLVRQLKL